jgi:hypothetical protein
MFWRRFCVDRTASAPVKAELMDTVDNSDFRQLRSQIESYPRLCGYYLIDLISVVDLAEEELDESDMLSRAFQHLDDQEWPAVRPTDHTWLDYRVERKIARAHTIEALVGGAAIGHTRKAMPSAKAEEFFDRFEEFFGPERHYYVGMGLGDQAYTFQSGVGIADGHLVGLLGIVDGD